MAIEIITVHCSATHPGMDIGVTEINEWHRSRGFTMTGYNDVIRRSGALEKGRPWGADLAHARGYNRNAIAVCLVGGVDENGTPKANFTDAQSISLGKYIDFAELRYPDALVIGHRDLEGVAKDCPCFDVKHWRATRQFINPRKQI